MTKPSLIRPDDTGAAKKIGVELIDYIPKGAIAPNVDFRPASTDRSGKSVRPVLIVKHPSCGHRFTWPRATLHRATRAPVCDACRKRTSDRTVTSDLDTYLRLAKAGFRCELSQELAALAQHSKKQAADHMRTQGDSHMGEMRTWTCAQNHNFDETARILEARRQHLLKTPGLSEDLACPHCLAQATGHTLVREEKGKTMPLVVSTSACATKAHEMIVSRQQMEARIKKEGRTSEAAPCLKCLPSQVAAKRIKQIEQRHKAVFVGCEKDENGHWEYAFSFPNTRTTPRVENAVDPKTARKICPCCPDKVTAKTRFLNAWAKGNVQAICVQHGKEERSCAAINAELTAKSLSCRAIRIATDDDFKSHSRSAPKLNRNNWFFFKCEKCKDGHLRYVDLRHSPGACSNSAQ